MGRPRFRYREDALLLGLLKIKYICDGCGGDVVKYDISTEAYWYCGKCGKDFYSKSDVPCATVHIALKRKT